VLYGGGVYQLSEHLNHLHYFIALTVVTQLVEALCRKSESCDDIEFFTSPNPSISPV
jgi:hypothetical protein